VLVDTHAHLHDALFAEDRDAALVRARAAGVLRVVTIGTDVSTSREAVALAGRHPDVYAAVGIHPHDAATADPAALAELASLAHAPKVVAIGEIGLDYYRNLAPREAQLRALRAQLALAHDVGKPVLVHCREAHEDVLGELEAAEVGTVGGILHCFSGDLAVAERGLALGLVLSIAGPVTYPNLPPQPWRGRRNEPAYLPTTAARVAELRGVPVEKVAALTTRTAAACLGLGLPAPPS